MCYLYLIGNSKLAAVTAAEPAAARRKIMGSNPSQPYILAEGKEIGEPYYDRLGRSGTGYVYQKKPTAVASAAAEPLP